MTFWTALPSGLLVSDELATEVRTNQERAKFRERRKGMVALLAVAFLLFAQQWMSP